MEENAVVKALAAIAQPMRLRIFRALVVAGANGLTPGDLADRLAVPPTTLSFHLKELANAGLISQQREGRNLIYRAAYDQMSALIAYLSAHCCEGQHCEVAAEQLDCHC